MSAVPDRLRENLAAVRDRISEACRRAGRHPDEVRLVGVTKYVTADMAGALVSAGCADVAESRPQSLWAKAAALADAQPAPRWHLVGHLQRNKVRRTVGVVSLLHSLDSVRLAETIELEASALGLTCDALVEVNLADDPGRTGVPAAGLEALLAGLGGLPHLRVRGLMGMASVPEGPDGRATARGQFAALREIRDALRPRLPPGVAVEELSMGMSDDFEEAILEGATLVRIGSRLWEGIPP